MKKKNTIDLSDCPDDLIRRRDVIAYILGRYDDQLGYLTPEEMIEQIKMIRGMKGTKDV